MSKPQTAFLEIVELPNGDIALRRPKDEGEPLVAIRFSAESSEFLGSARHLIAKAMIEAGLEAVHEIREQAFDDEADDEDDDLDSLLNAEEEPSPVFH